MTLKDRQQACQWCKENRSWPKCAQKQSDSVSMHMHSNAIAARGEDYMHIQKTILL